MLAVAKKTYLSNNFFPFFYDNDELMEGNGFNVMFGGDVFS